MKRLEKLSDQRVLEIAKEVLSEHEDDALQTAVEQLTKGGQLVTDLTRDRIADALIPFNLAGKRDLMELLRKHWPSVDQEHSTDNFDGVLADDIFQHRVRNEDWTNAELLERVGFMKCSQTKVFGFLEDVVHPIRRDTDEQQKIVANLNPLLERDGYALQVNGRVSGHLRYSVKAIAHPDAHPADELISQTLESFDEHGVHAAWRKALERRATDPDGAITAARTLLETVCKHVIEDAGSVYGQNDDLPKLYQAAAETLKLAPSQHSELVFKTILGSCQQVVGSLAALRNRLGDSHGQGKKHVKPKARHAELAVNLAGSMALFLISTWKERPR